MLNDPALLIQYSKPKRKKRPGEDDPKHLAFIDTLPCVICKRPTHVANVTHHHLLRLPYEHNHRGTSKKNDDRWCLPMCDIHHAELHAHGDETEFLALRGIDGPALAAALYSVSGDFEEAVRILG